MFSVELNCYGMKVSSILCKSQGYYTEVHCLKQWITITYVPSAAIEMILTFQCPFELFSKILPVTPQEAQAQYMSIITSTYIV